MDYQPVTVPRDKKTLEFYLEKALPGNLIHEFTQLAPGMGSEDFYRIVFDPMAKAGVFGDELLAHLHEEGPGVNSAQILMVACGYLCEALAAFVKKDRRRAWSCAMDAMYYCASAKNAGRYVRDLGGLVEEEVKGTVSKRASKSAKARTDPLKEVGAEAVLRIKARGDAGERWRSAMAAAQSIAGDMAELAKAKGVPFYADDGGLGTIRNYLTAAPELAGFFTEKRGRPKKKR